MSNSENSQKTLIVYGSKYGTTAEIAKTIADGLGHESTTLVNYKKLGDVKRTIQDYDRFILGTPIYAGRPPGYVAHFVDKYEQFLRMKEVHLFVVCSAQGEEARVNLEQAFTPWILAHATSKNTFGGKISLDRLKSMDHFLIRHAANIKEDVDTVDHQAIENFINGFH